MAQDRDQRKCVLQMNESVFIGCTSGERVDCSKLLFMFLIMFTILTAILAVYICRYLKPYSEEYYTFLFFKPLFFSGDRKK